MRVCVVCALLRVRERLQVHVCLPARGCLRARVRARASACMCLCTPARVCVFVGVYERTSACISVLHGPII